MVQDVAFRPCSVGLGLLSGDPTGIAPDASSGDIGMYRFDYERFMA